MGSQVHIQSLVLICHNILMTSLPVWPPFSINYLGRMLGISQETTKFKNYIFEGKHINSYLAKCNFTFCSTPRGQMTQDLYFFFLILRGTESVSLPWLGGHSLNSILVSVVEFLRQSS